MLSVVTITYNNFEELTRTVASVPSGKVEHIIVNGGSCPRTADFLKGFPGIQVTEPDRGISDAFNKGIRLSSGKGVLFLNSGDILLDPEFLDWADQALNEVDFVYSDIVFNDPIAGKIRITPTKRPLGRGMPFPHQTLIVRRQIFGELGDFKLDYKRAMCFEFVCRLIRGEKSSRYRPQATVLMEGGGISSTQEAQTLEESRRALIRTGLYDWENRFYFGIRWVLFTSRQVLLRLGLRSLLGFIKKTKYGTIQTLKRD
jgi:glycosyltransferase involved in cell wall biosynthesis